MLTSLRTVTLMLASLYAYAAEDADSVKARETVLAHYRSGADPVVEKAEWTANTIFNVGIHYMGATEDALADNICKVLATHGIARNTRVRVIDINSMGSDPKRWEVVGQSSCPSSSANHSRE